MALQEILTGYGLMSAHSAPLGQLARGRAERATAAWRGHADVFRARRPPRWREPRPGGDLDDPATLPRVLRSAAADGEVMLLCIGGEGSMRTGANLVLSFRAMRLHHMLVLTARQHVCETLWGVLPSLGCVWWPSQFARPRPDSLYNTQFSRVALSFFEARKRLLESLVLTHGLNVLHLDADVVFFANPYPVLKTVYRDYALVMQTDNPFANAGVFYVQNATVGSAAGWVLAELNRRIERFTYRPESVRELPSSGWSRAPHLANADEQANLNDVLASSLGGVTTFASGVEFAEARFKERFAPRGCLGGGRRGAGAAAASCEAAVVARRLMKDPGWHRRMNEAAVGPARRALRTAPVDMGRHQPLLHLCRGEHVEPGQAGVLRVPGNASAPGRKLLIAPQWLFAHFPYGGFFGAFKQCHAASWGWGGAGRALASRGRGAPTRGHSPVERRLCMPEGRVPTISMHMAGLRQEAWGRRTLIRALGVWDDAADAVAPEAWVSVRAAAAAGAATPRARRRAWKETGRLLVTEGLPLRFRSMGEFDRFAARLLLLGLLLRRRVVVPPIRCAEPWMKRDRVLLLLSARDTYDGGHASQVRRAVDEASARAEAPARLRGRMRRGEPVHLAAVRRDRGLLLISARATYGGGHCPRRYPHHIEPWCAGVDFLWDVDYRELISSGEVQVARDAATLPISAFSLAPDAKMSEGRPPANASGGGSPLLSPAALPNDRVLVLRADGGGGGAEAEPLAWLPLGGFRNGDQKPWTAPLPRRAEAAMRAPYAEGGLGLSERQMGIVRTCLRSLATSRE